jgi:hypothetical protein
LVILKVLWSTGCRDARECRCCEDLETEEEEAVQVVQDKEEKADDAGFGVVIKLEYNDKVEDYRVGHFIRHFDRIAAVIPREIFEEPFIDYGCF